MNLGGLEHRIDRRRDLDEIAIAAELVEEGAQVGKHHRTTPVSCTVRPPIIVITLRIASSLVLRYGEHVSGQHGQVGEHADRQRAFVPSQRIPQTPSRECMP